MKSEQLRYSSHVTPKHYPNQAEPGYFVRRFADRLVYGTGIAGISTILLFLFLMP